MFRKCWVSFSGLKYFRMDRSNIFCQVFYTLGDLIDHQDMSWNILCSSMLNFTLNRELRVLV